MSTFSMLNFNKIDTIDNNMKIPEKIFKKIIIILVFF